MTSAYAAMSWLLVEQAATGRNRTRTGNRAQSSGPSDIFRTRDGWIVVQVLGNGMFAKVARLVGHPEWIDDPRFAHGQRSRRQRRGAERRRRRVVPRADHRRGAGACASSRLPGAPVHSLQEALEEPQVAALGLLQEVPHPARPGLQLMKAPIVVDGRLAELRTRPPLVGEHTAAVLSDLGYSADDIATLRRAKVID